MDGFIFQENGLKIWSEKDIFLNSKNSENTNTFLIGKTTNIIVSTKFVFILKVKVFLTPCHHGVKFAGTFQSSQLFLYQAFIVQLRATRLQTKSCLLVLSAPLHALLVSFSLYETSFLKQDSYWRYTLGFHSVSRSVNLTYDESSLT